MTEATIRTTIAHLESLLPERTLTIGELWDRHQLALPDAPWRAAMASTMKPFLARFRNTPVSQFGPMEWSDYRDAPETHARYNVTSRNVHLRRIKACLNWGVATGRIPYNPIAAVKHEKGKPKRETEISHDGEAAVLARVDKMMRAFVLAALDGAMRRGEARLIEWTDIDFEAATVTLHASKTKSKRRRIVLLTPRALGALRALPKWPGCPWVFANPDTLQPYDSSTFWRWWRAAVDGAGLKPAPGDGSVRYHDARATAVSRLSRLGAPVPAIQKILGHQNIATTMLYVRVHAQDVADAYALLVKSQRKGPQRAGAQGATAPAKNKARA